MIDTKYSGLAEVIRRKSMGYGPFITLATPNADGSRNESNWYFNMRHTLTDAHGIGYAGDAMADLLAPYNVDVIVGIAEAGLPLMTAIQLRLAGRGSFVRALWVRKTAKDDHGIATSFEGLNKGERLDDLRVAVVEDLFTKGGSSVKPVKPLRDLGATVALVAAIGDREEGAEETFEEAKVPYASLFRLRQFLPAGFTPITRRKAA